MGWLKYVENMRPRVSEEEYQCRRRIGGTIRRLRADLSMSGADLVRALNKTRKTALDRKVMQKWEAGKMTPCTDVLSAIAAILGTDVEELTMGREENRDREKMAHIVWHTRHGRIARGMMIIKAGQELRLIRASRSNATFSPYNNPIGSYFDRVPDNWPEKVALKLRKKWELGKAPIADLVLTLRDFGVTVISDPSAPRAIWGGFYRGAPFLVIGGPLPVHHPVDVVKRRFGLLITFIRMLMLERPKFSERNAQKADYVARAFLLPESAVNLNFPYSLSIANYPARIAWVATRFGLPGAEVVTRLQECSGRLSWLKKYVQQPLPNLPILIHEGEAGSTLVPVF